MILQYLLNGEFLVSDLYFPLELWVAELLFLLELDRKKKFALRLALGFLTYLAFILLVPATIEDEYGFDVVSGVLGTLYAMGYSLCLFVVSVLVAIPAFDGNKSDVLFCCIAGYCVQHISFRVLEGVYALLPVGDLLLRYGVRLVLDGSLYFLFWFWLGRKIKGGEIGNMGNRAIIIFSVSAIALNIILCGLCRLEQVGPVTQVAESVYSAGCGFLILCLQFDLLQKKELERKVDIVESMWEKDREHFRMNKAYIDEINVKAHDLKYALSALKRGEAEDFAQETRQALESYASMCHTGNEALDVVLTEKSLYCSANGIAFTCMADGSLLSFMRDVDVYSCVGNALDNAITAVSKIEDPAKRVISVTLNRSGNMLNLHVENYFDGALDIKNGVLQTTKENKRSHGFGVKSIEMIAKRYDGGVSYTAEEGIFHLNVFFPYPPE